MAEEQRKVELERQLETDKVDLRPGHPQYEKTESELAKVQERKLRVKDSMEIEGPHGENLATVKKAMVTPVRERWVVKIKNGPDLEVKGNILDHEYTIGEGRNKVAEVSKKWFRLRDSYGVAIDPGKATWHNQRSIKPATSTVPRSLIIFPIRPPRVPPIALGSPDIRACWYSMTSA